MTTILIRYQITGEDLHYDYKCASPSFWVLVYKSLWKFLSFSSLLSDGETFISADDLRINLWNLEISNQSFNIVDVKPSNMEDLTGTFSWVDFNLGHSHSPTFPTFTAIKCARAFWLILSALTRYYFVTAEVITSAEFHPTHCNTLAYSSSKGSVRLIDLRQSALCDSHSKLWVSHYLL